MENAAYAIEAYCSKFTYAHNQRKAQVQLRINKDNYVSSPNLWTPNFYTQVSCGPIDSKLSVFL